MLLFFILHLQPAFAEAGLVVRLHMNNPSALKLEDGDKTSIVKVQFGTSTGQLTEMMLNDEGRSPDVNAGDGIFQGATMLSPEALTVAVVVGETQYTAGEFELVNDGKPKDLDIQQEDNGFVLQLSSGIAHSTNPDGEPNNAQGLQAGDPEEQVLVDGMQSVADDIAINTQNTLPSTTPAEAANTQPTPSKNTGKSNVIRQSTNGNSNSSYPFLPLIGVLFLFAAFGLFILQRIQSLQIEMMGIERLKTYFRFGSIDLDLSTHPQIVISADKYNDGFKEIVTALLNQRPILIWGDAPSLTLYKGVAYVSSSFDAMKIGDQVEQLKKRHDDLCLCVSFSDDSTYSDFVDALPSNTDMIWITKNASNPTYEMIQDNGWSFQPPSKSQPAVSTSNNEVQENTESQESTES